MSIRGRALIVAAIGAAALAAAPASSQLVINGTTYQAGDAVNLIFNGTQDTSVITGLQSELMLTFKGWNTTGDYLFDFALKNASVGQAFSEVTAFGFNTDPVNPFLSASSESSPFRTIASGSIANGYKVEFCVTGGSTCSGGRSTGPDSGETWAGSFVLAFAGDANPGPITLSNFKTRYQSVTIGNSNGESATGDLVQISAVPEPTAWAMMLLGFGAIGVGMRRRRSQGLHTLALA